MDFPNTDAFLTSLDYTENENYVLNGTITKVDDNVKSVIEIFDYVKKCKDDIAKADEICIVTGAALIPLSAIPVVGEVCSTSKAVLDRLHQVLLPIKKDLELIYGKIEPVHVNLEKLDQKMSSFSAKLGKFGEDLDSCEEAVKFTKGKIKSPGDCFNIIESFSTSVNMPVRSIGIAMSMINSSIEFLGQLDITDIKAIKKLSNVLDDIISKLNVFDPAINIIKSVLNQKITVPYSINVKVKVKVTKKKWYKVITFWDWKWETKTQNFTFKIQDIINGVNTGIEFVNDELMKLAKKALGALNIKLPNFPSLPGLPNLDKFENLFKTDFDKLMKKFNLDLSVAIKAKAFSNPCYNR